MRPFDHERMEVYRQALVFIRVSDELRRNLPSRRTALADQLDRASVSIALNIPEGAGEFSRKEKARFYRIARRSATECAAILDIAQKLKLADPKLVEDGKTLLQQIVAMLVGLSKWSEGNTPTQNERRAKRDHHP